MRQSATAFVLTLIALSIMACPLQAGDHEAFLQGPYPDGPAVTQDCLNCHFEQGKHFIETAHWLWKGPTPHVAGLEKDIELGKRNLMNNF